MFFHAMPQKHVRNASTNRQALIFGAYFDQMAKMLLKRPNTISNQVISIFRNTTKVQSPGFSKTDGKCSVGHTTVWNCIEKVRAIDKRRPEQKASKEDL